MKNVKFYKEKKQNNVIAVLTDLPANPGRVAAFSAVFYTDNSDTNFGEVSKDYLRENCYPVAGSVAMRIHPNCYNRALQYSIEP